MTTGNYEVPISPTSLFRMTMFQRVSTFTGWGSGTIFGGKAVSDTNEVMAENGA